MTPMSQLAAHVRRPPPWLMPYVPALRRISVADGDSVAAALNVAAGDTSVRFVAQAALPPHEPYERFIHRTCSIPTRDNVHDLLNGLVWLSFPATKQRLNVLQAQEIGRLGAGGQRGALRDALTIFDENAALLTAPAPLLDALRRRDWHTLFVLQRKLWESARLVCFGHGLLEKLLQPRKAITAHVWVVDELSDAAVATSLLPAALTRKPFLPLPVLGVPGWWHANEDVSFYADAAVFRPNGVPLP
jgi:hypothetical protein